MQSPFHQFATTCCIFTLSCLLVLPLYASHIFEGNLSYKCLGGNNYEIQLVLNRHCSGVPTPNVADIFIFSNSCGVSSIVQLLPVSNTEVSALCSAEIANSDCNAGTLPGVTTHIYLGQTTLINCNDWLLSYTMCCRSAIITNSASVSSFSMYFEAMLNNLVAPCNSSASFTSDRPIYLSSGTAAELNLGGWDPDGDSLSFSLVNPLGTNGVNIPYQLPFDPSYPIGTSPPGNFVFDVNTGQMNFTPVGSQVGIVSVVVKEYRNGVLIGSSMIDKLVHVSNQFGDLAHSYQTGTISGGTINAQVIDTEAGQTLDYSFSFTDPDTSTLSMMTDIGTTIPGATLTAVGTNPLLFSLVWPITQADVGFHNFTVSVSDNFCPVNKHQDIGFLIKVSSSCTANFQYLAQVDSAGTQVSFTNNTTPSGNYIYLWDFGDGNYDTVMNPTHYYSDSTSLDSIQSFEVCLTITDSLNCSDVYCDSLSVFVNPLGAISGGIYEGVYFAGPGDPIPNVKIHLQATNGTILQTDTTGIDGLYSFQPILLGSYVLSIDYPGVVYPGYPITLTHSNPYFEKLDFEIHLDGGISTETSELSAVKDWTIIPNPVSEAATVLVESLEAFDATLILYSVSGVRLLEQQAKIQQGVQTLELPTNKLEAGMYFLMLQTKEGSMVKRLVKL